MGDYKCVVIDGAMSVGKTAIINELKQRGHVVVFEVAWPMIEYLDAHDFSELLPQHNRLGFQELVFPLFKANHEKNYDADFVFYDRGFPGEIGFMNWKETKPPQYYLDACQQYRYDSVFFPFPWEDLFESDPIIRPYTFKDCITCHEHLLTSYRSFGYDVTQIPRGSVQERTDFVLANLA